MSRGALRIIDILQDRPILVFEVSGERGSATFLPASKFLQRAGIEEKDIGYGETSDRNDTARQLSSD